MADQNRQNQNPDRSPSGNDPNRRRDNANQGTEGGRSTSNRPGEPSKPEKGKREGVPGTEGRYDAERDWTPGGRGEAPEVERGVDDDIDRPETGMPGEKGGAGGRGDKGTEGDEGGGPGNRQQNDAGDRVRLEPESGRS